MWLTGAVVALPMVCLMVWLGLRTENRDQARRACLAAGTPLRTLEGTLRSAGPDFYVVGERWTLISHGCNGKYRLQCLRQNPGVEALERHLGQPVQAQFCGPYPVGYRIAGQAYRLGQPVER